jgi:hypothetical protein
MAKRYAFFKNRSGVCVGSMLAEESPSELNTITLEVADNFDSTCKLDLQTNEIIPTSTEEYDLLLKESLLSNKEFKLKELNTKYNQAQFANIVIGDKSFTLSLRNASGYSAFKERCLIANSQGSAKIFWFENNSQTYIEKTYPASVFNQVMNEVDPISVSNYISYQGLEKAHFKATEENVNDIVITFPAVQTITITV